MNDENIKKSIYKALRTNSAKKINRSYVIADFRTWVSPYNKVLNCWALTIDGFIQYKFQWLKNGNLKLVEAENRDYIRLPIRVGKSLSFSQLGELIEKAVVY